MRISSLLCTDLAELHSEGSCAVQVSVVVHPSGWGDSTTRTGCKAYILQHQQHPNAAQQQQLVGSHGPYDATLKQRTDGTLHIVLLQHDDQLTPYLVDAPHTLVLQERVRWSNWQGCI